MYICYELFAVIRNSFPTDTLNSGEFFKQTNKHMALTKRQKAMRKRPVTEPFKPCRVEKRDRSSNVLKRLGRTGAIFFYAEEIKQLLLKKRRIKTVLVVMKDLELKDLDGYTIWYYRATLQNVNNKLERYNRFLTNLLNNTLTAKDLPNNHD
jgi:hypothetical protein